MPFNPDTHRRRSTRLPRFDYASPGAYFLTAVTKDRECVFGDVVYGVMRMNDAGRIVDSAWRDMPKRFPHVVTDAWVVMPNHVHGVLFVTERIHGVIPVGAGSSRPGIGPGIGRPISIGGAITAPLRANCLGQIVGHFKYQTTVDVARTTGVGFMKLWQRNYWERVIRDEQELNRTRQYVIANPSQWNNDEFNTP